MEDWKISLGMACHKIFNSIKFSEDDSVREEAKSWFQKAICNFIQIIKAEKDENLVSDSWRHLGELFKRRDYGLDLVPENLKKYVGHPEACFDEALSVSPKNPRILARYAKYHTKNKPTEAMRLVNQSIKLDDTAFNIHAYGVRATIYIEQYKQQLKANKGRRYNPTDETLLTKAEDDLKKTFDFCSTPMDLEIMSEVLYYMATDSNGRVKQGCEGERKLLQALTMCTKAAACQDGEKRALVHKVRGQPLCALGEHQAALRSFQRAVECEITSNFHIASGNLLVSEYEHVLRAITDALPCNSLVFADMVYWLPKVAKICLSTNWVMVPLTKLQKEHPCHWKTFVEYCKKNHYIRELHDIRRAAMWTSQPLRYHSFSTEEKAHIPPVSDQYKLSSAAVEVTTSEGYNPHARVQKDKEAVPSEGFNLHAEMESSFASLFTDDLGGNDATSDFIRITYRVNRKTGKTRHIDTTQSSQDWTTDDVSSQPIRAAPETSKNGQLTYDFFVVYSDSASEWVFRRLLEELEGSGLKGCIKDRDFMLGKSKLNNYQRSFTNSVCTIIVLTTDFEADIWCLNAMLQAIELNKLLIPVLRQRRDIPMFLNALVHLDATGAVDWERLKRSIEQQIKLDAS